ncbi:MAG: hypothetical protein ACFB03_11390 [Paracoccaceae bacterium]
MKTGATISGSAHLALVAFAIWGVDFFSASETEPLTIAEIELVDGTEFDAALSTAPFVQSEGPAELSPPSDDQSAPDAVDQSEDETASTDAPTLSAADAPEDTPVKPEIALPPPPTEIPTEAPRPSIAEIPSPDSLDRQAAEPESPDATEPQRAVSAISAPLPSKRPDRPPDPEPEPDLNEPEPERESATLAEATPEQSEDQLAPETDSTTPNTDPLQPLASTGESAPVSKPARPPEPEPEPEQQKPEEPSETARPEQEDSPKPDPEAAPTEVAKDTDPVEEEAPEGPAPQIAKLPVAKPADKAAAALAASRTEQQKRASQTAEAKPKAADKPAKPTGSSAVRAPKLSRGERDALRIGIKKYYTYNGDRSDRSLRVTVRVKLDKQGKIVGKPTLRQAAGGTDASQRALFNAGRRAISRAASAGEFRRLPADKYDRWKVLNFRFSTDKIGFSS